MTRSIWQKADLYGQLVVWIISVIPFIYFLPDAIKTSDYYVLFLVHGLGLMIIGLWQTTSAMINLLKAQTNMSVFFRNNLLVGLVLATAFVIWSYMGNVKVPLPPARAYASYYTCSYFLVIDFFSIRYWLFIRRYYRS